MKERKRLSVIIPAHNEEENIKGAVRSVLETIPKYCEDFEIIVVDDRSLDKTPGIVDGLGKRFKKVKIIHNKQNRGFGGSYWRGVEMARYEYCMMVWGDNAHTEKSLRDILSKIDKFDVVIPNYINMETRTWIRRTVSKIFTFLVNVISGYRIGYYNGTTLYRTNLVKSVGQRSTGFSFQAEVLVFVLSKGIAYTQVNTQRTSKPDGPTLAFKFKNMIDVIKSLFWILKVSRFSKTVNFKNEKY